MNSCVFPSLLPYYQSNARAALAAALIVSEARADAATVAQRHADAELQQVRGDRAVEAQTTLTTTQTTMLKAEQLQCEVDAASARADEQVRLLLLLLSDRFLGQGKRSEANNAPWSCRSPCLGIFSSSRSHSLTM